MPGLLLSFEASCYTGFGFQVYLFATKEYIKYKTTQECSGKAQIQTRRLQSVILGFLDPIQFVTSNLVGKAWKGQ